jgi:ADP-heptose:LPS heptosyltransferase
MRPPPGSGRLSSGQLARLDEAATVVVINTHGIGDVLMGVPMLGALCEAVGADRVETIVRSHVEASVIERELPNVQVTTARQLKRTGVFRWAKSVRARGPSVALSMFNVAPRRASLLAKMAGSSWSVGFSRGREKPFDVSLWPVGRHKIDENFRLLDALQVPYESHDYTWSVQPSDRGTRQFEALSSLPLITLAPGSNQREKFKRWAPDAYASLIATLLLQHDATIVLLGAGDDRDTCEAIRGEAAHRLRGRIQNLAGELTLHESAAIIERCSLMVGGDGGLTHIGAALGVPTIVLVGPTRAAVTAPRGPSVVVLESAHWCNGCYELALRIDPSCGFPHCMTAHSTQRVATVASEVLSAGLAWSANPPVDDDGQVR